LGTKIHEKSQLIAGFFHFCGFPPHSSRFLDTSAPATRYILRYTLPDHGDTRTTGERMELVVIATIVALGFGAAATWLIATRLPAEWIERTQTGNRYGSLAEATAPSVPNEADARRMQARTDTRRIRRARVRANSPAMTFLRAVRLRAGKVCAVKRTTQGSAT
jgi:hypothetical protein